MKCVTLRYEMTMLRRSSLRSADGSENFNGSMRRASSMDAMRKSKHTLSGFQSIANSSFSSNESWSDLDLGRQNHVLYRKKKKSPNAVAEIAARRATTGDSDTHQAAPVAPSLDRRVKLQRSNSDSIWDLLNDDDSEDDDAATQAASLIEGMDAEEGNVPKRSMRYLPRILREAYAMRQTRRPSSLGNAALASLDLHLRLRRPRALPYHRDIRGTILILDMSGFTALGERLRLELGPREGAAEFAGRVDKILSSMVEQVHKYGGDVLMFAGDALICFFKEREDANVGDEGSDTSCSVDGREAATKLDVKECGLRVLGEVAGLSRGEFSVHGGAAHGLIRCFFLGRPSKTPGDCAFVVSGAPLRHSGMLLNKAGQGEVLIDGLDDLITEEQGKLIVAEDETDERRSIPTRVVLAPHSLDEEEARAAEAGKMPLEIVDNYDVHPYAMAYLHTLAARRCNHDSTLAMDMLLNELRPVAIVFVGLHDLDDIDAQDATLMRLMNDAFVSLSRITHSCNGAVRDMLFDDKGCVFISVFGAHSHEVNPCFDATVCAMRMKSALDYLRLKRFSLGVSFGDCFCGEVGPSNRSDFVVMGTEVNMAARLMGKAPNKGILVSKRIVTNSKRYIRFSKTSKEIKVKGKSDSFHAYIPQGRIERGSIVDKQVEGNKQQPFVPMPSRQIGVDTMMKALSCATQGRSKIAFVCGGPFLGKSRMIQIVCEKAVEGNFTILQSFRTSLDSFTSYFPFRQILSTALRMCASRVAKTEVSDDVSAVVHLIDHKVLNKTDRVIIGSILPTVSDSELMSLLKGQNPNALTTSIVDSVMKVLQPLQPLVMVFEGDGDIDPSTWCLVAELMKRAVKECPQFMILISSRNSPHLPSAVSKLQKDAVHVTLTPFEKFETKMYLRVLLGIRDRGIGVDEKLLDVVHGRADGCPLFIEYIVTWALDKGMIEHVEETNKMSFKMMDENSEDASAAIPRNVSNIVLAAFNDLSPVLWDTLKIASCIGYSFDANVYEALNCDFDFIPKIKELESSYDAFEHSSENRYKWKHQAVYEAVKSLLMTNQRVKIHSMIVEVFERRSSEFLASNLVKADVHRLLARHCSLAGKWGGAFNQYMEAGKRAQETYKFSEAAKMYEEAIACQSKLPGPIPLWSRLLPTVKLGSCLRELARYQESEAILTQCLEEAESEMAMSVGVGDEKMYVDALTALAALHQAQSKYDDARKLYEKALPIARQNQESKSCLWLAGIIAGYAETLRKSGDLPPAEQLHREVLDIRNQAAEEKSCTELELAVSYTQLGCTLFGMKCYEEAYEQHHSALICRFKFLDFSHGLVSESLNYCAESLCALGRGKEGIPLAMHAVEIRKVVFGTSHPAFAHALSVLASCYHDAGRSSDAVGFLEQCLNICEAAFQKNHANMIPNLINYGDVLCATGNYKKAREVFEKAVAIHKLNFKQGQKASQLEKCTLAIQELNSIVSSNGDSLSNSQGSVHGATHQVMKIPTVDIESGGTPIILLTDIGRDVDDELTLVLLASLKNLCLLNPIAVVTTLSPQEKRAWLARGALDALGMSDVPVGIGGSGGVEDGQELEFYGGVYARPNVGVFESGMKLMVSALESSPPKSVQFLCIASFTDAATLIEYHTEIFVAKVKEVVIMGGLKPFESNSFVEPDSAYNNNCDVEAVCYVYKRCQELGIATRTLTRWAAYASAVPTALFDDLSKTEHMVATNVRSVSASAIERLWKKVSLPPSDPRREKLPARCNRQWFCQTFLGKDEIVWDSNGSIWSQVTALNMYDPLALLSCIPAFRDVHFKWETKIVNSIPHVVAGMSKTETGVINADALREEFASLFRLAFKNAMQCIS